MNREELDKLCQDCREAILHGARNQAIKMWRAKTGQGLKSAKQNIDIIESGEGNIESGLVTACPVLIKEYRAAVQSQLLSLDSLTVLEVMECVPTLRQYLEDELDRWYIMYKASLEPSVFQETAVWLGEDSDQVPHFGSTKDRYGNSELADIASKYQEVIKKISMHNQMLAMMKSEDFPGETE